MPTSTLEGGKTTQGQARVFLDVCELCGAKRVDRQIGLESTHDGYVAAISEVFAEVFRVLKDDGTLWLNLGDTYVGGGGFAPNAPTNLDRADGKSSAWGSFNPASMERMSAKKSQMAVPREERFNRRDEERSRLHPTLNGLKNKDMVGIPWRVAFALQGFVVVNARSMAQWADDLAAARVAGDWEAVALVEQRLRATALIDVLSRMGWYLRADVIWSKPNPMPESVTDRTTKAHEYIFLFAKSGSSTYWTHRDRAYRDGVYSEPEPDYRWKNYQTGEETADEPTDWRTATYLDERGRERRLWRRVNLWRGNDYYYDAEAIFEPYAESTLEEAEDGYNGESMKFEEFAAASSVPLQNPSDTKRRIIESIRKKQQRKEPTRGEGYGAAKAVNGRMPDRDGGFGQPLVGRNKRSVWTVSTQPYREAHFATYPEKLIEPCILASSQPGDIVIDVFNGSGTTGVVATGHDRHYIGCELNPKYHGLSRTRIGALSPLFTREALDLQELLEARRR